MSCGTALSDGCLLSFEESGIVCLIYLIGGEVGCVNIRRQARFEGGTNSAKAVELDSAEEMMALDFMCSTAAKTVFGVADEASIVSVHLCPRV